MTFPAHGGMEWSAPPLSAGEAWRFERSRHDDSAYDFGIDFGKHWCHLIGLADTRGWRPEVTALADLATVETRYEPSGRQWAMRLLAEAKGVTVTELYLTDLAGGRRDRHVGGCGGLAPATVANVSLVAVVFELRLRAGCGGLAGERPDDDAVIVAAADRDRGMTVLPELVGEPGRVLRTPKRAYLHDEAPAWRHRGSRCGGWGHGGRCVATRLGRRGFGWEIHLLWWGAEWLGGRCWRSGGGLRRASTPDAAAPRGLNVGTGAAATCGAGWDAGADTRPGPGMTAREPPTGIDIRSHTARSAGPMRLSRLTPSTATVTGRVPVARPGRLHAVPQPTSRSRPVHRSRL